MAITTIPWNDGSGDNIYVSAPSQTGSQTVEVTSDANTGAARSKVVTFTSGVGSIVRQLTVSQEAGGPQQHTLEVYPSSYDDVNSVYASVTNIARCYTSADSTNNGRISYVTGENAETFFYFKFDLSSIPSNATIDSIALKVKLRSSTILGTRVIVRNVNVCRGTSVIGQTTEFTATVTTFDIDCGTGWTGANIQDLSLRLYAQRGNQLVTNDFYISFYGATLTITYTV